METHRYIMDLAIILLTTKLLGLITRKFQMPQVVGALLAGLVMGPAVFGVVTETDFITNTAEIGVIVLMFCAGMETDVKELKQSGRSSFIIALLGVLIPLAGGFYIADYYHRAGVIGSQAQGNYFLQRMFVGIILTATSVSITVETLKELGKLKTRSGNAILGAAIIDDVLGIVGLTVITSLSDPAAGPLTVFLKIAGFFLFSAVIGIGYHKFYTHWVIPKQNGLHRHVIIAFVFCLLMSYMAEAIFGVANITGAFVAGIIISGTQKTQYLASKFDVLSYAYLSPVFFASIGIKVVLPDLSGLMMEFAVALVIMGIVTKIFGCWLGGILCKYTDEESVRIGIGMVSRGEAARCSISRWGREDSQADMRSLEITVPERFWRKNKEGVNIRSLSKPRMFTPFYFYYDQCYRMKTSACSR